MNKYIETMAKTIQAKTHTNTLETIVNTTMSLVSVYVLYYIITLKW